MLIMLTPDDIREIRFRTRLNMAEFGKLVGVSEATVSYWESGKKHPRYATAIRLNQIRNEQQTRLANTAGV